MHPLEKPNPPDLMAIAPLHFQTTSPSLCHALMWEHVQRGRTIEDGGGPHLWTSMRCAGETWESVWG